MPGKKPICLAASHSPAPSRQPSYADSGNSYQSMLPTGFTLKKPHTGNDWNAYGHGPGELASVLLVDKCTSQRRTQRGMKRQVERSLISFPLQRAKKKKKSVLSPPKDFPSNCCCKKKKKKSRDIIESHPIPFPYPLPKKQNRCIYIGQPLKVIKHVILYLQQAPSSAVNSHHEMLLLFYTCGAI